MNSPDRQPQSRLHGRARNGGGPAPISPLVAAELEFDRSDSDSYLAVMSHDLPDIRPVAKLEAFSPRPVA